MTVGRTQGRLQEVRSAIIEADRKWAREDDPDLNLFTYRAKEALDAADAVDPLRQPWSARFEEAVEFMISGPEWCPCRHSPYDKHDVNPPCETRVKATKQLKGIIAILQKEDA